jgi:hypothetical protein
MAGMKMGFLQALMQWNDLLNHHIQSKCKYLLRTCVLCILSYIYEFSDFTPR